LFRIENGKLVERWDTIETIPRKSTTDVIVNVFFSLVLTRDRSGTGFVWEWNYWTTEIAGKL